MTMEEAIQALKDLAEINVRHGCDDKWITALNMAIEALSAKPQTDLISRADAIEAVADAITEERSVMNCGLDMAIKIIKALPSADAVSREVYDKRTQADEEIIDSYRKEFQKALSADAVQGEWKIDEYGIYHCPFCHAINNTVYKSFCPNCGARMKGGAE